MGPIGTLYIKYQKFEVRNGLQISYTIPEVNLVGHMETGQNPLEADELLTS